MINAPGPLIVPPVTGSPGPLSTGSGSPVRVDSSHRAAALDDRPVARHALARAQTQAVARAQFGDWRVALATVLVDPPRVGGRKREQGADGAAGAPPRGEFKNLAEQRQGRNQRRRLEPHRRQPRLVARRGREYPRRQDREQTGEVGRGDAQPDQREHVEVACAQRKRRRAGEAARPPTAPPATPARVASTARRGPESRRSSRRPRAESRRPPRPRIAAPCPHIRCGPLARGPSVQGPCRRPDMLRRAPP